MGLALKGKAERNKKHERNGEVFQTMGHSCSSGSVVCMDKTALGEDVNIQKKFHRGLAFLAHSQKRLILQVPFRNDNSLQFLCVAQQLPN